jgi:hypothetical protein
MELFNIFVIFLEKYFTFHRIISWDFYLLYMLL